MNQSTPRAPETDRRPIFQADALRPDVRQRDLPLCIYYDESNNPRKFLLGDHRFNEPDPRCFVLAGVAHNDQATLPTESEVRKAFRLQSTAKELKFKNITKGDFETALASRHMSTFLDLFLERGLLIHLSVLDPVYWSLVDIIDSLMADPRVGALEIHEVLKTALRNVASADLDTFLALLRAYTYPDVPREAASDFIQAVSSFVDEHGPEDDAPAFMLRRLLRKASRLPDVELPFLHDNDDRVLIESFSDHFLHRVYTFSRAHHIFDKEDAVEPKLRQFRVLDGNLEIDYRFADSKDEVGIQLADVVCGTFRELFNYLQDHDFPELLRRKAAYSRTQQDNRAKLRQLIDRSDQVSEGLFHCVLPLDIQAKHNALVHES